MSDRREQPNNTASPSHVKALTPRAIAFGGLILTIVAAGVVALFLTVGISSNQLDAIRTGGTLVVGAGGAVALLLAARRQRSTELELEQKYEVAADARTDATERRITELYIKAADQLGSDKAPVRLAGLYALERLAQDTPRLRQTIANVICAYLRMPYTLPISTPAVSRPIGLHRKIRPGRPIPSSPQPPVAPQLDAAETARQEREVRLTAQAILTTHLRPGPDLGHPVETFWDSIDLDLTNATLIIFNLDGCHIRAARFNNAQFIGTAAFNNAHFTGDTRFNSAQFTRAASFNNAQFTKDTRFNNAQFTRTAWFSGVQFTGDAQFYDAQFTGNAWFYNVQFIGDAWFSGARFTRDAQFNDARFTGDAWFNGTRFTGNTRFNDAQFTSDSRFNEAQFTRLPRFNNAQFKRGRPSELTFFVSGVGSPGPAGDDMAPDGSDTGT